MKVRARLPIKVGENEQFSPTVAEKLIGQTTKDGWIVIAANNDGPKRIWLTVEKNVEEKTITVTEKPKEN